MKSLKPKTPIKRGSRPRHSFEVRRWAENSPPADVSCKPMKRINLSGGNNAAPTSKSNAAIGILKARGWTVAVSKSRKRYGFGKCPACHKSLTKTYARSLSPLQWSNLQTAYWRDAWHCEWAAHRELLRKINAPKNGIATHQESIAALRRGAKAFGRKVGISLFKKHDPLERIYWQKWCALDEAADYLACLKK